MTNVTYTSGKERLVWSRKVDTANAPIHEDEWVELFDLDNDVQKLNNLSSQMPHLAIELKDKLLNQINEVNARFATPIPSYKE
jgi:hypothetical protein